MSTATRTTVDVWISPFVTSTGVAVTDEDVDGAGQVNLRKGDGVYVTDEGDLEIERSGKGLWMVKAYEESGVGFAEFTGLQEARKGAAAIRRTKARLRRERENAEAQAEGFKDDSDRNWFEGSGRRLADVATNLAATANSTLGVRELTWNSAVSAVVTADEALRYVGYLWNLLGEGGDYREAMAQVEAEAAKDTLRKARYAADHTRLEDACAMQASARVADGELWGFGSF